MEIAGNILIGIGLLFMITGVIGLIRFNNFYARILIATKIDTVGTITLLIGIILRSGVNYFSLKILIIIGLMILLNPLAAHVVAHSAYTSDLDNIHEKEIEKDEE